MRFLKKLLVSIYLFLGIFSVVVLLLWVATGDEPDTLITAVFAASGVEFIVSALMKLWEIAAEVKKEKDLLSISDSVFKTFDSCLFMNNFFLYFREHIIK